MNARPLILVVDDDGEVRSSVRALLEVSGHRVNDYASARSCLNEMSSDAKCLICDVRMPDMDGLELQAELVRKDIRIPLIFITGRGDVGLAVRGLKAGALDYIEKPFDAASFLRAVNRALLIGAAADAKGEAERIARRQLALLTKREHEVFGQLVTGHSCKNAAFALGISPRTLEVHRSHIMKKLQVKSLAELTRIACAAP